MDSYTDKKKIPTDIIIASFRGELTDSGKASLDEWLSSEVNKEKYEALRRVWDSTVANAGEFDSDKSYRRLRNRISNVWKHIAVASSAAAVAVIGFTLFNICGQQDEPVLAQTCACVTGKSSVILPDGSKIVLHKGASLSYDSSFSSTNRAVSLDGEAYFEVAKDSENTFTVNVDDIDIIVHGTSFNVHEDAETVKVSLVEGAVEVMAGTDIRCELVPGHSAIFDKETGTLIDRKDDVTFAACWAQDRLKFTQASLGEVCRYLSKWYGVDIVVADALKSSCSYTFTIREEPLDQILDIMRRINPMRYMYTNDNRIIISEIL